VSLISSSNRGRENKKNRKRDQSVPWLFSQALPLFSHITDIHKRAYTFQNNHSICVLKKIEFLCELFFVGVIALWLDFLIIFSYDANAFPRMGPIFQQPMRRVRHDLMDHFNFFGTGTLAENSANWYLLLFSKFFQWTWILICCGFYEEFDTCMFWGII
jgi:hypothetical protein